MAKFFAVTIIGMLSLPMKVRYISALALITALTLTACSSHPNVDIACDSESCISPRVFSANIRNYISNRVAGYVLIVGQLAPMTGGYARSQADPPVTQMSPDLVTNIASISKTLTTIGVLQSLARHGLTIDDRISPYLDPDWIQGPNISTITFGELMSHRSGFRYEACNGRPTYADLKALIAAGVTLADKKVAVYNNCNFAIFREMLPFMEGHPITGSDDQRAEASSTFYINYMNQHVFQPVGIPQRQCKPPDASNVILSYSSALGSESGTDWGDWTLSCAGGGWVVSAADLYAIFNDLANGNILLTQSQKAQMNANCLGWDGSDCSILKSCPSPYKCKDGFLVQLGGINLRTYVGIFNCSVPVVLIVNSPLPAPYQTIDSNGNFIPGSGDIYDLVRDAYNGAGIAGTPGPARQVDIAAEAAKCALGNRAMTQPG